MKKFLVYCFITLFIFTLCGSLWGQTNEKIDSLLSEDEASYGKAAYMILTAAEIIGENSSDRDAVTELESKGWSFNGKSVDDPISLGEYSLMVMRCLDIPGGLMYSIFQIPRYAVRELAFLNIIIGNSSSFRSVSGEEVIVILGKALEYREVSL